MTVFVDGDEVPGFLLYGLFPAGADPQPQALPEPVRDRRHDLHGEGWQVCIWTVAVTEWASGAVWQQQVRGLLTSIRDQGAQVAWLASEGCPFVDPPWLFDPEEMSGGVDAYLCGDRYACPIDPEQPWASVGDDEMGMLRELAPLARAGDAPDTCFVR